VNGGRQARWRIASLLLAAFTAGTAGAANAQEATVTAAVLIVPEGYEVVGTDPLDFGTLVIGQASKVDPEDPAAGRWESGPFAGGKHDVELTIQMPAVLTHAEGGGSLPVNWDGDFALVRSLTTTAAERWNPTSPFTIEVGTPPTANASPNAGGRFGTDIEVFIGGEITADQFADAAAGNYSGSLLLTVIPSDA
jgi:hypothetical protein